MKHTLRGETGFTLIELLIVIAIIGVLAAVLLPNLMAARNRALDSAAQACGKELLLQAEIYAIDNQSYVGFDASGDYEPNSCNTSAVAGFSITTADASGVEGTVTSRSSAVFTFSRADGVKKQ